MSTAAGAAPEFQAPQDDRIVGPMLALALRSFARWRRTRRAIHALSNYSDVMLKDIGLTRGEIDSAVREGTSDSRGHPRRESH